MNDLTSLRELGEAIDTELRGPSPQLRHRVLTDIARSPGRVRRARPRFAPGWRLAVTGGLGVALAAALLAVSTLRLLGAPPGATAAAATILDRAAAAAARQADLTPRPSQYVFIRSLETGAVFSGSSPDFRLHSELDQSWLSVTGRRDGLLRDQSRSNSNLRQPTGPWQSTVVPGCRPGHPSSGVSEPAGSGASEPGPPSGQGQPVVSGASPAPSPTLKALTPVPGSCAPEVADPVLPTTPGAMLSYLYRTREGDNPPAVESYIHAGDLLRQDYLRPAALAALFRALERIPGVSVAGHAVNLIGQRGIAVQQTYHGISDQLIFNPRSYAVIGEREVVVGASSGLRVGAMLDATAVLQIAVVDHVGQRP
jgi:hypothetical protein